MKENYDLGSGKRGAVVPAPPGKVRVTLSLDEEILDWFRAQVHAIGGGNYQTLINDVPRDHVQRCLRSIGDSGEPMPDDGADVAVAWESELARRVEEIESGRAVGKPADQVFAELREKLR